MGEVGIGSVSFSGLIVLAVSVTFITTGSLLSVTSALPASKQDTNFKQDITNDRKLSPISNEQRGDEPLRAGTLQSHSENGSTKRNETKNKSKLDFDIEQLLKKQMGGDEPLTIDKIHNHTLKSYEEKMLMTKFENRLANIIFIDGIIANSNKRRPGKRVIFKTKPNRRRHFSLSEIVLKLHDKRSTEHGDHQALVATKKGRVKIKAVRFKDFAIFNVSSIVDESTKRVKLLRVKFARKRLDISVSNEPLWVTYENIAVNPLLNKKRRVERSFSVEVLRHGDLQPRSNTGAYYCRRVDWILNMTVFNYDWYLHPMTYNAGYCIGVCPVPMEYVALNATNYSFIKQVYHARTAGLDGIVPQACCTPIAYDPQSLYYINSEAHVTITTFVDMKVTACGCR